MSISQLRTQSLKLSGNHTYYGELGILHLTCMTELIVQICLYFVKGYAMWPSY